MAELETVRRVFDVAEVVRELRDVYVPVGRSPRIRPIDLRPLLAWLRTVTVETRQRWTEAWQEASLHHDSADYATHIQQLQQLRDKLNAWDGRLGIYEAAATACPDEDAQCTLWSVVAPLFFGFYDGARGTKTGSPDLDEPLVIANALAAAEGFRADRLSWAQLWRDVKRQTGEVTAQVTELVAGTVRALAEGAAAITAGAVKGVVAGAGDLLVPAGIALAAWWFVFRKKPAQLAGEGG